MTTKKGTTKEHDIAEARRFIAELYAFEVRMNQTAHPMFNRGQWLEAVGYMQKARDSLKMFIGRRMTDDLSETYSDVLGESMYDPMPGEGVRATEQEIEAALAKARDTYMVERYGQEFVRQLKEEWLEQHAFVDADNSE